MISVTLEVSKVYRLKVVANPYNLLISTRYIMPISDLHVKSIKHDI